MGAVHFRNLGFLCLIALLFYGTIIPFSYGGTYDAYVHMFFGDHYHRSWFDAWEPRWYTGFATTSYPPGTHMAMGLLMHVVSMTTAFIIVMTFAILILVIGFYRFVLVLIPVRAAFISTLLLIFCSSVIETVHIFGQLPTIFSLGIFLNALPSVYKWLTFGHWPSLLFAVILAGATTAGHHVTTIFGSVFFIGALAIFSWSQYLTRERPFENGIRISTIITACKPVFRGGLLAILMIFIVLLTVFPYWYWSFSDPIKQVPIPHGTRENFVEQVHLGIVFFIIPWGINLIFLPYVAVKGLTSKLWPFSAVVFICFILGLGGTTPISKFILRGAFDILTLDRFTFWATILALPFIGVMIDGLLFGRSRALVKRAIGEFGYNFVMGSIFFGYTFVAISVATFSTVKTLQPRYIDPGPIVQFMSTDEHDRWRYLTLGMGDQFANISARMTALSVDGNYHSARRLPDFTNFAVERLENAKYLGVGGLGSLQQFITNANRYNLKYIFSNDKFYDPLLYNSGWHKILLLPNGIEVWEKPGVEPIPFVLPRRNIPPAHQMMWSTLPPFMLILGYITIFGLTFRLFTKANSAEFMAADFHRTWFRYQRALEIFIAWIFIFSLTLAAFFIAQMRAVNIEANSAESTIRGYYTKLNLRDYYGAYQKLDPESRPRYDDFHFTQLWAGGLLNSFGELTRLETQETRSTSTLVDFDVKKYWLTSLGNFETENQARAVKRGDDWYVVPQNLIAYQTPERLQSRSAIETNVVGRRQPRIETDVYSDRPDRPEFAFTDGRIIFHDGKYMALGIVTNTDVDPMYLSVEAKLLDEEREELNISSSGIATPFRMLPGETSGVRVDFEGILTIQDAADYEGFDPDIYTPPVFDTTPTSGLIEANSNVVDQGLYRDVFLKNIVISETDDAIVIRGNILNSGTKTIITAKLLATFYDLNKQPLWVEAAFSKSVLRPGQESPIELRAPKAARIEVVYNLSDKDFSVNTDLKNRPDFIPNADESTIPADGIAGYSAVRLYLDPMLFLGEY